MFAYCLNDPVNRADAGGYKSFKKEDEINDGDKHFNDVTGGGGGYYYCVDLSLAARSPIMSGGVYNYGYVHSGYSAPVYGNGGGNANTVGGGSGSTALVKSDPLNNGAIFGTTKNVYLQPGTLIDRYGGSGGKYFSPAGTPLEMRSLSPKANTSIYSTFVVLKPFEVEMGIVAPAYGHKGYGIQYRSPVSVRALLNHNIICYKE